MSIRLGIIGGGVMAEAILTRLLASQLYNANTLLVSEPQSSRRIFLAQTYGVGVTDHNQDILQATEALLLAVKPQILDKVTSQLSLDSVDNYPLILSILAGIPLNRLENAFPNFPVIRVMPNTPATVGTGMTAIAAGTQVKPSHVTLATSIFEAVGEVVEVPESLMDGVTGLSGSGPAFVALMIEALSDGGVASGLPRAIATKLAVQTVLGTATLMKETGLHPGQLKDNVTSPGGTTIAGVAKLEEKGFRSAVIEAVKTAYRRSQELGK
ncbi:pyrroline-5-carboxylate reductase [Crocosphaera chwakensis]|uniref:Pyrroline-5-carboxylate reductase n=1 Tax=Crocosphaera chwakensis CCY0110 TaxID=391612 RepID=A3IWN8_9CHRO|nr:pyrroline-5-carboxylate reductase [Crocosphaera chwakensis]EAZ89093.1 pyrroline-5-carboxylate reductase [Crocosphaera chwakensis CCY0110]